MKDYEMFARFLQQTQTNATLHGSFSFATDADALARLVLQGKKKACSSAYELYGQEGEPLPAAGQYSVVLDSRGEAVCVIRTSLVYVCAFEKVAPLHAVKEGEGSFALWRKSHEAFFRRELEAVGLSFSKKTPVVCEEFELVYPLNEEACL